MKIEKILPRYAWIPLFIVVFTNSVAYFFTRLFTQRMVHYNIGTKLDDMIPLIPIFVSFYILAYAQWIIGYVVISGENETYCYDVLSAAVIAKLFCMVCFVVFPTTIDRPEVVGNGIWEWLVNFIYSIDAPDNLFPSIHCLESYVCIRFVIGRRTIPAWYKWVMFIFSIGVFASTVFMKQHFIADMFGAVLVVEIGMLISKRFKTGNLFRILNSRIWSKK